MVSIKTNKMDEGVVYYREIGRPLKVLTSPVLRKIRKEQRLKSRNVFTQSAMQNYWCRCLKNEENSEKVGKVKTLFESVLDFVAGNAEYIDSLIGIPELIGEQIFSRHLFISFANHLIPASDTLKPFAVAYRENILQSLQLSNSLLAINEFLDLFQLLMPHLRELDLSKCFLGDNHELIEQIRDLRCLERLNISENALTDKTLRKMTIMYPQSPVELKFLDLSGNRKITSHGLQKLICFEKLHMLNISGLNIDVDEICVKLNMEITNQTTDFRVTTSGWSSPLINGLLKAVNSIVDEENEVKDERITRFYGSRRKIRVNLFNDENPTPETVILTRKNQIPTKRKSETIKSDTKKPKMDIDFDILSFYK